MEVIVGVCCDIKLVSGVSRSEWEKTRIYLLQRVAKTSETVATKVKVGAMSEDWSGLN